MVDRFEFVVFSQYVRSVWSKSEAAGPKGRLPGARRVLADFNRDSVGENIIEFVSPDDGVVVER